MGEALYTHPLAVDVAREYFRGVVKGLEYLHAQGIVHRDLKCVYGGGGRLMGGEEYLGVVHRDLKCAASLARPLRRHATASVPCRPSNILIQSAAPGAAPPRHTSAAAAARSAILPGVAKIADFGLSALLPLGPRGSASTLLVNVDSTPAFMAPEMFTVGAAVRRGSEPWSSRDTCKAANAPIAFPEAAPRQWHGGRHVEPRSDALLHGHRPPALPRIIAGAPGAAAGERVVVAHLPRHAPARTSVRERGVFLAQTEVPYLLPPLSPL